NEFENYFKIRKKYNLPYIINLTTPNISEKIKYTGLREKYYLVNTQEEELELVWYLYFLNSKYSVPKLCKALNKKIKIPKIYYDFISGMLFDDNNVGELKKDKYLVEKHDKYRGTGSVFFINNYGKE